MRRDIASLHAKTNIFCHKVETSRRIIADALHSANGWYVGFSTGKDSTVVFDLVHEQFPDIPAVYGDEEWLLPESEEYLQRIIIAHTNIHRIKAADTHAEWFKVWQDDPEAIHSENASGVYAATQGWKGVFLGLRQEESNNRRMMLRINGPLFFAKTDGFWRCNPLSDWTWRDVWAYIISRSIDYNKAYDRLEELGVPPERQRIGPLAQERVLEFGQMVILKRGWPDLYNRFVAKYPEARQYN